VTWQSIDEKTSVKWAVYRFVDSTCVGASIRVNRTSAAYTFSEILTYVPNSGYSIENEQDLRTLDSNSFYLSGELEGKPQPWRIFFDIGPHNIPVNFWWSPVSDGVKLTFTQGKEELTVVALKTDSGYIAEMPVFQSYLKFERNGDELIGTFHNLDRGPNYEVAFIANKRTYDQSFGYDPTALGPDFSGKWETYFYDEGDSSAAIGMFERFGDDLIGTFATETGDYRFLQGKVVGDSFYLSTFDGSHLFLFTGKIVGDAILDGHFYSGNHYHTTWTAKRNEAFELRDPNSMTSLSDAKSEIDFSFPDLKGNLVSLSDAKYQGKVVILQVLGSWCPNCVDETRYFTELYSKYNSDGLEIIGLGFERSPEFDMAKITLSKAIADLDVPYSVLVAGTPKESAKALPMITPIKSYPTSIFINRKGEVVKIHTGFYGPSTGKYYNDYCAETELFVAELLNEK
jgi:thiol-disulfide isomerase/thioredoxin